MLYKSKVKKGSSLIEIVISMALLAILMIPLSSAIIQLVKTNKNGEVKQIASFEGQKILEEFKGYSEMKLTNNKFTLLNGAELEKVDPDKDEYKSKFNVTNRNTVYEVDLSVVKEESFDNTIKDNKEKLIVDFDKNNKVSIEKGGYISIKNNYMKIKISNVLNDTSNYLVEFFTTEDTSKNPEHSLTVKDLEMKEILINVAKEYTDTLKIEIENITENKNGEKQLNFEANIYKSDNESTRGVIDISSITGKNVIRVNRNLEVGANGTLEQLYRIMVNVKKKGQKDLLFESSNTQNIIIN